jgi:hypothetical protein
MLKKAPVRVPRFGEYGSGFISLAAHLDDTRMPRYRCNERIVAVGPECRRKSLQIRDFQMLIANANDLVLKPRTANEIYLRR